MAFSVSGCNFVVRFPVGIREGARSYSHSQDYRISRARNSSSSEKGRCQHVKACWRKHCVPHCPLPSSERRSLRTPALSTGRPCLPNLKVRATLT